MELAFDFHGTQGTPIVILHGLFGSGRNWQTIARNLAGKHQVFLPDLRNHGVSPHSPTMDFPHLAADISALIGRQQIKKATLIGHSMGGKVAMWLALTKPNIVDRLIVVDIAPVRYQSSGFESIIEALRNLPVANFKNRREADDWLASRLTDASLRQFLLQNLVRSEGQYRWRIDLNYIAAALPGLLEFPITEDVLPFRGKTLFIAGSESPYIKESCYQNIFALFPNTQIEIMADAGHWLHAQQPEHFVDLVSHFLKC